MAEKVVAKAKLVKGDDRWIWLVRRCPLCGKHHTHDGGPLTGNPRRRLGLRTARCFLKPPGTKYTLMEE